jgi:hypothetical protein
MNLISLYAQGAAEAAEVLERVQDMKSMSNDCMAAGIMFLAAAVISFSVFRIPHSIAVITGIGARREIADMEKRERKRERKEDFLSELPEKNCVGHVKVRNNPAGSRATVKVEM